MLQKPRTGSRKICFESHPVYIWLNEHIEAHFATCFLALVLIKLLEHRLGHVFPVNRIIDSIKKYTCVHLDTNTWQFTYYDEILAALIQRLVQANLTEFRDEKNPTGRKRYK